MEAETQGREWKWNHGGLEPEVLLEPRGRGSAVPMRGVGVLGESRTIDDDVITARPREREREILSFQCEGLGTIDDGKTEREGEGDTASAGDDR
jgi:hypothetical protein